MCYKMIGIGNGCCRGKVMEAVLSVMMRTTRKLSKTTSEDVIAWFGGSPASSGNLPPRTAFKRP